MDIFVTLSFIFSMILLTSYGWGMRGTTIGGEKGAMLPGAIIGTLIAIYSGIYISVENFFVFASLGAIGMYFGGCMTYGETLSLSMSAKPAINMKKGLFALFLKGALWFGVFASVFSTGVSAISGIYNVIELLVIFIATPVLSVLFLFVFNRPHNTENAKFPRLYFSKTRKEYWGAMAGIVLSLLVINIYKLNLFSILFTIFCFMFGGFGFLVGQLVQIYIKHYAKNSRFVLFKKLFGKGNIDSWKAMECTFGAIAGLGCAVSFLLTKSFFSEITFNMELNGGPYVLNERLCSIGFVFWLCLVVIDTVHYFIKKPLNISELKELKNKNKISDEKYQRLMFKAVPDSTQIHKKRLFAFEVYEFIVYAAIPFIFICLGSINTSVLTSLFIMYWVLVQEIHFEKNNKKLVEIIPSTIIGILLIFVSILFKQNLSFIHTMFIYTVFYELGTLYHILPGIIKKSTHEVKSIKSIVKAVISDKAFVVTHVYFVIVIIIALTIR